MTHHKRKSHGIHAHGPATGQHSMPADTPPVPPDCHVGINFTPDAIMEATSRRCKLLGQGACGRVHAADLPAAGPSTTSAPSTAFSAADEKPAGNAVHGKQHGQHSIVGQSCQTTPPAALPGVPLSSGGSMLPKRVAIKTALPSAANRRSLLVEAKALHHTSHPAVIKLLGTCWSDVLDALVFELLPGGNLQARIAWLEQHTPQQKQQQQQPKPGQQQQLQQQQEKLLKQQQGKQLPWHQRLLISYQLASALAALHSSKPKQLLHRDMKPENVLLDGDCNARLSDFGIATVLETGPGATAASPAPGSSQASGRRTSGSGSCSSSCLGSPLPAASGNRSPYGTPPLGSPLGSPGGCSSLLQQPPSAWGGSGSSRMHSQPSSSAQQQPRRSSFEQQQQHGHHAHHGSGSSGGGSCKGSPGSCSAAEAVLARLAARGIGSTGGCGAHAAATGAASKPGSGPAGAAAAAGSSSGPVVVVHHGWAGTHEYLDPCYEQLGQLCALSDVYGLGLIMCQLLLDHSDPKVAKRILQHTTHEKELHLPPTTADWPAADALAFADLALHAAAADRQQRPTAAILAARLRDLLLHVALATAAASGAAAPVGFRSVVALQPGIACLVPSCLHGAAVATEAAAAAAAAAVSVFCPAIRTKDSSAGSITAGTSSLIAKQLNSPRNSSCGSGTGRGVQKQQQAAALSSKQAASAAQQQQKVLQQLVQAVMTVELLLHPCGAVAGGSITLVAPGGSAAAAAPAALAPAAAPASAAGVAANSTAAAAAGATPTLQVLQVVAGRWVSDQQQGSGSSSSSSSSGSSSSSSNASITCYSNGSSSVVFLCRKKARNAAIATHTASSSGDSTNGKGSWFAFVGQYQGGRLSGLWSCVGAEAAAAIKAAASSGKASVGPPAAAASASAWSTVLSPLLNVNSSNGVCGSGSSSAGDGVRGAAAAGTAAAAAAASYDWVMQHSVSEFSQLGSVASSAAVAAAAAVSPSVEVGCALEEAQQQHQQICAGDLQRTGVAAPGAPAVPQTVV